MNECGPLPKTVVSKITVYIYLVHLGVRSLFSNGKWGGNNLESGIIFQELLRCKVDICTFFKGTLYKILHPNTLFNSPNHC